MYQRNNNNNAAFYLKVFGKVELVQLINKYIIICPIYNYNIKYNNKYYTSNVATI